MPHEGKLGRRLLLVGVLVAVGIVLVGGWFAIGGCLTGHGCPYDFTYLPALRGDPMASYQPPGTELVEADYLAQGADPLTGGSALIQRLFRILDQDNAEEAVAESVSEAESEAWAFNSRGGGCKRLGPGVATFSVTLEDDYTTQDPEDVRLQILLMFSQGSVPSCGLSGPSQSSDDGA